MNDGFQVTCGLVNDPKLFLADVKCERNPHSFGHVAQCCWYSCDEWCVLEHQSHTLTLNSKCRGERVILYSSSGHVWQEPWGTNPNNDFVFWRNRFYRVGEVSWRGNWVPYGYPLVDRPQLADADSDNETRPSYKDEGEDGSKPFMRAILKNPEHRTNYLVFADWLEDYDEPYCGYIRDVMETFDKPLTPGRDDRLLHYYRLRPSNTRTAVYTLNNLFQNAYAVANADRKREAVPPANVIWGYLGRPNTGKVIECQGFYSHPLTMGHPLKDDE